jgi:phosphoribosyl 1,2-cyclic phosphodiesterase
VSVNFTILGSGSAGNCAYLETPGARLLIDAGFTGRQIRKRLEAIGKTCENLSGIVITHEHSDHISGLLGLVAKLKVPVYCNRLTYQAVEAQLDIKIDCRIFETGSAFAVGDITVDTFAVPHDAYDPVNFLIHTPAGNIGVLTDLGHVTKMALERVRSANVLVMESNHDVKMLQDDPRRPWSLKQRILSRHGHLSNESAADAVEQLVSADLQHIYLGHISRDCNRPEIAQAVMDGRLKKIDVQHIRVELTRQDAPCQTLALDSLKRSQNGRSPNGAGQLGLDFPPGPPTGAGEGAANHLE